MKTLEFIYQDTQIHFLLNPTDDNVMVNATEMAKLFEKRMDVFLKSEHAKAFINVLLSTPYGGNKTPLTMDEIIFANKKAGTYMHRILALKFAAWLSPEFEVWVFSMIDQIMFGSLKDYRDALKREALLKSNKAKLKQNLIENPNAENVMAFFDNEEGIIDCQNTRRRAVNKQMSLFEEALN